MGQAGYAEKSGDIDEIVVTRVLDTLASELRKVRVDFALHTEGYHFQEHHPGLFLAHQLPYALRLRDATMARPEMVVRLSPQRLSSALEQLEIEIRENFVGPGEHPGEVFAAYAAEHRQTPRN